VEGVVGGGGWIVRFKSSIKTKKNWGFWKKEQKSKIPEKNAII